MCAFSFAGILLVIGVTVFNVLVVARSDRIGSELVGRMESRAAVVGIAASLWVILGAFTQLYLESRMMSQMAGMQTMSIADMAMHTRWGFAMRLEIISAFLALVSFAVAVKRVRGVWLGATLFAAVLALTPALGGHAAGNQKIEYRQAAEQRNVERVPPAIKQQRDSHQQSDHRARAVADTRWQSIAALVNTFSPIALVSASVVLASGLVASWVHLDRFSDLWTTAYGQMLFRKLVFVAVTLTVGAYNFRRVQPQLVREHGTVSLRRSTTIELSFAVIILVITGFLTGISP